MSLQPSACYRLHVITDADPGSLARVLERFQNLNVLPCRLVAEHFHVDQFHIQVDICGLSEQTIALTEKIAEATCVHTAYWHRPELSP